MDTVRDPEAEPSHRSLPIHWMRVVLHSSPPLKSFSEPTPVVNIPTSWADSGEPDDPGTDARIYQAEQTLDRDL